MIEWIIKNIQLVLSIITAITAIIGIVISLVQINLSNKHRLFEKRLENYTLLNLLLSIYKENNRLFDYSKKDFTEVVMFDSQFIELTNIDYLKDYTELIGDPKNNSLRVSFLTKLEELKCISAKLRFIFPEKIGESIADFVFNYQNVLLELYKYSVLICDAKEFSKKNGISLNKELKNVDEQSHRIRLFGAFHKLELSYNKLEKDDIVKKMEKSIKL